MTQAVSAYSVEERIVHGETVWVAIRARGAEWSWLTPAEAAWLGQQWVEKYGSHTGRGATAVNDTSAAAPAALAAAE